jgi:hypothetical protein
MISAPSRSPYPKRYNPRIVAQRGVFTIHGCDEAPLEVVFERNPKTDEQRLARIDLSSSSAEDILNDLWTLGVNRTALFPEPASVAEDLRRLYGVDDPR